MPHESKPILVAPGTTPLGREVCRLGRSAGHEMTSLAADGRPAREAPWLHGVAWSTGDATDRADLSRAVGDQAAVLLLPAGHAEGRPAIDGPALDQLLDDCRHRGVDRLLYVTVGRDGNAGEPSDHDRTLVAGEDCGLVVQLPEVDERADVVEATATDGHDSDRRCPPIPVGQAAMAVLRAAVEPGHGDLIGCREATELGYAVMIRRV